MRISDWSSDVCSSDLPIWVAVTASLIEYQGEEMIVASAYDLTEQPNAEAQMVRQRDALYQSEKLSALGSLLAGGAHELNNPLSSVVRSEDRREGTEEFRTCRSPLSPNPYKKNTT